MWRSTTVLTIALSLSSFAQTDGEAKRLEIDDVQAALSSPDWNSFGGVGLTGPISFVYQIRSASELQVEYFQRVLFFMEHKGRGIYVGALELRMNTGGETYVLVYQHKNENGDTVGVSFEDRYGKQYIDLQNMEFSTLGGKLATEYLGVLNGGSLPLRFESDSALPEKAARIPVDNFP